MNRSLRVAFDNSLTRRNLAGTGTYTSHLIRELRTAADLKVEVFDGPDLGRDGNGTMHRVLRRMANVYWSRSTLPQLLREGRFDVLHGPAFVIPRNCPCPSVVTIYDLSFLLFPSHFRGRWGAYVASHMLSILRLASAVICLSNQTKQDLMKFYKVSPEKVRVVYCGVDHSRFHQKARFDPEWASKVGMRDGYVLHVGSLAARKNIPTMLRAVAHLRSKGKWGNRQVVLSGSESRGLPGAAEVYETIEQFDLTEIVLLPGHVPDDQVPGLYAQAGVLVMPTLYEGFGLPVLEAMASGTPVVASNNSSIPEVAGDAALLVPTSDHLAMADAIERILENPQIAAQLRAAGLVQAQKFSWQRMAAETIAIYRSVAK
ncbi:MAG: glycosyltransferase family 4 protein [Terriglobales bacterium]